MSAPSLFPRIQPAQPSRPGLEVVKQRPIPASLNGLRAAFWSVGVLLAIGQAWVSRYQVSADSISYLDMSDGVLPGSDWHRLINGIWSPLYPAILGVFRRVFNISPQHEIVAGHLLNRRGRLPTSRSRCMCHLRTHCFFGAPSLRFL